MKKKYWIRISVGVAALLAAALIIAMVARRTNDQPEVGRTQSGQEQMNKDNEKNTDSAPPGQPEGTENRGNENGSEGTENDGNENDSEGATELLPEQDTEQPGEPEPGQDRPRESKNPSPIELPFLPYEG